MSGAMRFMTAAVALMAMATSSPAEDQPAKQWVWLSKQGVWGYGYRIQDGPQRGLWRVDPDSETHARGARAGDRSLRFRRNR